MSDCNQFIEHIYVHPDINALIEKIHPESIRDDLRQEIALSLLEMPCDKIAALFANNNLLRYAIKICWVMATSKTSEFYYKYKKRDILKAVEYLKTLEPDQNFPLSVVFKAKKAICDKHCGDVNDDHEARIFNKFIELGGVRKVARYFGIPDMHVSRVVSKVKTELKQICLQSQ